ncbi:MAG: cyclic nucleotide-binding domain-containing protein [Myxococcota bacterium]
MPDPTIREILANNFLFRGLSPEELTELADQVWVENHPEGETIVRESAPADALFLLVSGGVNVVKRNGQFLAYLGPGGFFGEMALFIKDSQRTANVIAAEPTRCVVLSKEFVERFCEQFPSTGLKIYRAIIESLAQRLQATSADLAMLMEAQVKGQDQIEGIVARARAKRESNHEDPNTE